MVRIGIIGMGTYGITHINSFLQRQKVFGDIEVVGFSELNEERRKEMEAKYGVKGYADFEEMITKGKVDAVTVVTPDHLHHQIVMKCLDHDIAVMVEKPLATDYREAREMADKAREKNLLLQVDFHKRFDPYHIDLKDRISSGELGELEYGYFWMEDVLRVGTQMIGQAHWGNQGSPAWFLGIHMIDLSYWMMNNPRPVKVYATGCKKKLLSMGIDIYDSVKAHVTYDNGVSITYDTSVILPDSHEAVVRQGGKFIGTEGFLEVDSQYRGARGCMTKSGMITPNMGGYGKKMSRDGSILISGYIHDSIIDFAENVKFLKGGGALKELEGHYADAYQGIDSTLVGIAIHKSLETGEVCTISELEKM